MINTIKFLHTAYQECLNDPKQYKWDRTVGKYSHTDIPLTAEGIVARAKSLFLEDIEVGSTWKTTSNYVESSSEDLALPVGRVRFTSQGLGSRNHLFLDEDLKEYTTSFELTANLEGRWFKVRSYHYDSEDDVHYHPGDEEEYAALRWFIGLYGFTMKE